MCIAILPLLNRGCIQGHDVGYHLLRIESLKNGIQMGKPFLKINTLFLNDSGYASSMFYPDLMLYFPAILRVIGVSISTSFNLFLVLCVGLSYASSYYCTKLITKSSYSATIASIVFTLCQYHIDDIYVRSAVGEIIAFIFIPFLLYGIYDIFYEKFQKPWIMAVGFIGVMLCHTVTLMIFLFLYATIFIIHIKTFIEKPTLIYKLVLTSIIVCSITAFYWLPMLEQMINGSFGYSVPWGCTSDNILDINMILSNKFTGMGFAIFVLCFIRIFIYKVENNINLLKFGDECLAMGILFTLAATKLFPWVKLGNYVAFIQFPWRLYIVASICLAISIAIFFELYSNNSRKRLYTLVFIICLMCISAISNFKRIPMSYKLYSDDYYKIMWNTADIGSGSEWLPLAAKNRDVVLKNSNSVKADNGQLLSFKRVKNTIAVDYTLDGIRYIDVPFIYYKGYSAFLLNNEKEKLKLNVTGDGENGFCRVKLPEKPGGVILIKYEGTLIQNISYTISILALLIILGIYFNKRFSI